MNPSTGTFISMDTYQGSIFEPATLHKYLYANANPVMNVDPSGYFSGNKVSQGRITVNPDGSISIIGDDMLYVSIDNGEHSIYFLNNKRGGVGDIVEFNIPKWLFDFINGEAIPQAGATANPGYQNGMAPQIVDPTMQGNAYGLPDPWIEWLMEYATNGKVTSYQ